MVRRAPAEDGDMLAARLGQRFIVQRTLLPAVAKAIAFEVQRLLQIVQGLERAAIVHGEKVVASFGARHPGLDTVVSKLLGDRAESLGTVERLSEKAAHFALGNAEPL